MSGAASSPQGSRSQANENRPSSSAYHGSSSIAAQPTASHQRAARDMKDRGRDYFGAPTFSSASQRASRRRRSALEPYLAKS